MGRAPAADEVGERLIRLARRTFGAAVEDASPRRLTLALHPAASPVTIAVLPDGDLEVRGETSMIGPGYHTDVIERLGALVDELDYVWADEVADHATVQARMAEWLAGELRATVTRIGMPADRTFHVDAPIQTAMGPRDDAWRAAVIADPLRGADAFAWWDRGPGHADRATALYAMWHEVPWREPIDDDEHLLMRSVDSHLRAARKAAPDLELPWHAWAELLECLGEGDRATKIRARAGDREPPAQPIGYRRYSMDVEVADGWSLVLPGSFVSHWEDDDSKWWATDGDRVVEMTTITVTQGEPATDSTKLLAVAPELHPVRDRFVDGNRRGRIEVFDDGGVHVLYGIVAAAPHVALVTFKSHDREEGWALAAWRSLVNAS